MLNKSCVIIEDSKIQAKIIAQMLSDNSWESNIAHELAVGISLIRLVAPSLVFVDLGLPDSEGAINISKVKEVRPDAIIIAMSATTGINEIHSELFHAKEAGADFILTKPFSEDRLESILDAATYKLKFDEELPHILVIDDSKAIRNICQNILKGAGFRVSVAENVDDAVNSVDVADVDAILTDLNMPGIQSDNVIPFLRDKFPLIGIIAMSADNDCSLSHTVAQGADAFISKPFDLPKLLSAIYVATDITNNEKNIAISS